ncbi:MAG: periplasmic heavy metal sensor [Desulfobacterales bacterium]|nr:periplasmic heavy metal sensor [Desulfobacterales bacterium]
MKLKRILGSMVVIVTVLAIAGPAMARGASKWRWWQNDEIITQLNLSTDEIKALDGAYVESRSRLLTIKGRVEAERFKLEALLSRPEIDAAAIREQNRTMESARSELAAERLDFLLKSREVLGHERFQKLTEIQRQWREERRKRRQQKRKNQARQDN